MRKCHHVTTNQVAFFHGFFQFNDGESSGPVAVVELPSGIVDCWMAERTVFEDAPQETVEQNGHFAQQLKPKMPSFADVTKDVQFMTVDEGNKAFVVYSNIARHFGH